MWRDEVRSGGVDTLKWDWTNGWGTELTRWWNALGVLLSFLKRFTGKGDPVEVEEDPFVQGLPDADALALVSDLGSSLSLMLSLSSSSLFCDWSSLSTLISISSSFGNTSSGLVAEQTGLLHRWRRLLGMGLGSWLSQGRPNGCWFISWFSMRRSRIREMSSWVGGSGCGGGAGVKKGSCDGGRAEFSRFIREKRAANLREGVA